MSGFETAALIAAASGTANTLINMKDASEQRRYQRQQVQLQAQHRNAELKAAQRKERENLRRQKATVRARFGAMGVGSAGGSSQAVLRGLSKNSHQAIMDMRRQAKFGRRSLLLEDAANGSAYRNQMLRNTVRLGQGLYDVHNSRIPQPTPTSLRPTPPPTQKKPAWLDQNDGFVA